MKRLLFFLMFLLTPFYAQSDKFINPTSPKTQGLVVSADSQTNSFKIEVDGNVGLQMIFYVTDDTEYFVSTPQGTETGSFSDIQNGAYVNVVYTTNDDMTESIAEEVTVDTQK